MFCRNMGQFRFDTVECIRACTKQTNNVYFDFPFTLFFIFFYLSTPKSLLIPQNCFSFQKIISAGERRFSTVL